MRTVVIVLALVLGAPGVAAARSSRSRSRHHTGRSHGHKSIKRTSGAVAGALSDSDRPAAAAPQGKDAPAPRGPQRIDFDDRLIQGQTNKSGAVYLYDRPDLKVNSMVKQPVTFRQEIAKGLFE